MTNPLRNASPGGLGLWTMVDMDLSALDPASSLAALQAACREAAAAPGQANLIVGRFVDQRRHHCNYDDVFNVSTLPAAYRADT